MARDTLTKEEQEEMEQNQQVTNFGNFKPYLCTIPEEVAGFRGQRISYIAAGYCYSLAVAGIFLLLFVEGCGAHAVEMPI